jgi:hypothetical protein
MKKLMLASVCLAAVGAGASHAQTINNNFSRDRSVSVAQRARPEYAPLGLRLGAFRLSPTLTAAAGYNDNVFYTETNEKSSGILVIAPRVSGATTWSRHALAFNVGAISESYGSASSENSTEWNANLSGRLDINSAASVAGDITHARTYESRYGYQSVAAAAERTPIDSDRANLSVTLIGNRLRFIGALGTSKETYGDVPSQLGGTIFQGYRDMTTMSLSGRVDYAISPALSVFVSVAKNERDYEAAVLNDSEGSILAVGSSFDISALARGEVQVGSFEQTYKGSVGKQSNAYINALVEYFPSPLTTVTGTANRYFADYPSATGAGTTALNTRLGLSVDHELLRNLILSAGIQSQRYEFQGIDRDDKGFTVNLGGRYLLNRRVSLEAAYTYRKYESEGAAAFRNFTDNALLASVVLAY